MVTIHRAENTDDQERMTALLSILNEVAAKRFPLVFALHPRTAARLKTTLAGWQPHPRLHMIDPVGYLDSLALLANARVALTDSGGLQKEALFVGCPCVTLRAETEWIETLAGGANVLVDADSDRIRSAVDTFTALHPNGNANFSAQAEAAFGRGDAAANILQALDRFYLSRSATSVDTANATHGREPETIIEGARA